MFSSRKTFQNGQREIVWNDSEVFRFSLCKQEENIDCRFVEWIEKDEVIIKFQAEKKRKEPLFGQQEYIDGLKGISYQLLLPKAENYTALYQHKPWWIRPSFVCEPKDIPEQTQLLLFKIKNYYFVILALCDKECKSKVQGMDAGVRITCSSNQMNRMEISDYSLVITAGIDPYKCCEKAVKRALLSMGKSSMFRRERTYPEMFEYFGWCSWDAFYHQVSHNKIIEKMDELKEKEIPVKWVLIDDGWLNADYEKQLLKDFDADPVKFPKGLKECVITLKDKYDIKSVGVWHAIMGYWNGIEGGSQADIKLSGTTRKLPDNRIVPDAHAGNAFLFYDRLHEYLQNSCGIDFIKVDGQSSISLFYTGLSSYGKASGEIQKGLNASAGIHFKHCMINCMGMGSEDMFNRVGSSIARSSDDFVPEVLHGFREHAIQNAYNSLLQGQFFWNDWDMFWSSHEESWQNSILRAVSGGPVYVSDGLGKTDASQILPLICKDGKIIRCQDIGIPTTDCLFHNPVNTIYPLKIFNRYEENYVITALNINQDEKLCEGNIKIEDIPTLKGRDWLVYHWKEQKLSQLTKEKNIDFNLLPNDGELFLLIPKEGEHPVIGIIEKYIGIACVKQLADSDKRTTLWTKEKGHLGIYTDRKPVKVTYNQKNTEFIYKESGLLLIDVTREPEGLVDIDWKE